MNLQTIYEQVNFLTNKDLSGYTFSPKDFSTVSGIAQLGIYVNSLKERVFPAQSPKTDQDVSTLTILDQLIKTVSLVTPYSLPTDFFHQNSIVCDGIKGEILSSEQYNESVNDPFYEPSRTIAKIEQSKLVLSNIPISVSFSYYRTPVSPYFDYCISLDGTVLYMEPATWLRYNNPTFDLVRATVIWSTSTPYTKGQRLVYNSIAYLVLNNITSSANPIGNSDYQPLGLALISANVSHVSNPTSDYYSISQEADIPSWAYNMLIEEIYKYAVVNLNAGKQ